MSDSIDFPLPPALQRLIENGFWPRTQQDVRKQNLKQLVSIEKIKRFAPDEDGIVFYPPPFFTIAQLATGNGFWKKWGALNQIKPTLTLDIGDFGSGSDRGLALDYQHEINNPSVIRLQWIGKGDANRWIKVADTFDEFVALILE